MKICEIFHSLQGEGKNIGLPTIFLRTTGCNLRCDWCDTRYAWDEGEEMKVKEVKKAIDDFDCNRICITGGEPLLNEDIYKLIDILTTDYSISVETNGSLDISKLKEKNVMISMDYKTPSSSMEDKMNEKNLALLKETDQLKFVIFDEKDYNFSKRVLRENNIQSEIIFQPVEGKEMEEIADAVIEDNLEVRVLPQLHKIIWDDETRGV